MPPHEVAGDQVLDALAVQALGVELPVEPLQGRQLAELRLVDPSLQSTLEFRLGRAGQEAVQELQV